MKAPDKIFLVKPLCASEQDHAFISDVELPHYLNTCYIRRDALLEWLEQVKSDVMIAMNIDKVIDKINSL